MARPREFDEDRVLEAARDAFWSGGVVDTSITDLSAATGLSVGSIYKAFGSKESLCHRTLDTYLRDGLDTTRSVIEQADSPLAGIEAWLEVSAQQAARTDPTRGCYAVNCAIELADSDPAARSRLQRHDRALLSVVHDALTTARRQGELSVDPRTGARLLCTTVNGLQVEARKGITLDEARATLALALHALR